MLAFEMALSGLAEQTYSRGSAPTGGPAFLVYYSPAFLRSAVREPVGARNLGSVAVPSLGSTSWLLSPSRQRDGEGPRLSILYRVCARTLLGSLT